MMKTDFTDDDSIRQAGALNGLIVAMSPRGFNFGWKSPDQLEPSSDERAKAVLFCKYVICYWHRDWVTKYAEDEGTWTFFSSKRQDKPAEEKADSVSPPEFDLEFDD